jgi:hypothetical protein
VAVLAEAVTWCVHSRRRSTRRGRRPITAPTVAHAPPGRVTKVSDTGQRRTTTFPQDGRAGGQNQEATDEERSPRMKGVLQAPRAIDVTGPSHDSLEGSLHPTAWGTPFIRGQSRHLT